MSMFAAKTTIHFAEGGRIDFKKEVPAKMFDGEYRFLEATEEEKQAINCEYGFTEVWTSFKNEPDYDIKLYRAGKEVVSFYNADGDNYAHNVRNRYIMKWCGGKYGCLSLDRLHEICSNLAGEMQAVCEKLIQSPEDTAMGLIADYWINVIKCLDGSVNLMGDNGFAITEPVPVLNSKLWNDLLVISASSYTPGACKRIEE